MNASNRHIFLFILITITIAGSLVNSNLFIYQTLASYFLFTISASVITIYFGLYLIINKSFMFSVSIPVILFLSWGCYIMCNHILTGNAWNLRYSYLTLSILLYFSLSHLFSNRLYLIRWIYIFIITAALLEAIVCIFQCVEFTASFNTYFTVTGTQVNPNITAMFLAMATGPALCTLIYRKSFYQWLGLIALPLIIIALILLKCRTAYLGLVVSTLIVLNSRYHIADWVKAKKNKLQVIVVLVLIIGASTTLAIGLYHTKQASADGRKTIWKIASHMIVQKPAFGFGYGLFERNYNLQQAKYFEHGKASSKEADNADFVRMAYSEPMENAVEGGIIGLAFFMSVMIGLLIYYRKFAFFSRDQITNETELKDSQGIFSTAYAGIAAFFVMSLGNFTIQAIPVMCLFLIYASILTSVKIFQNNSRNISNLRQRAIVITSGLTITVIALFFCYTQIVSGAAHLELKQTLIENNRDNTQMTLETLSNLKTQLSTSEGYYRNYARLLMDHGNYQQALEELKKASEYTSLPDMYLMMGLCNVRLGNFSESERNFSLAMFMVPTRFIPKYYLMKLYQQKGDTMRTLQMAQMITTMKIKIHSNDVDFYKKESSNIIRHYDKQRK